MRPIDLINMGYMETPLGCGHSRWMPGNLDVDLEALLLVDPCRLCKIKREMNDEPADG